jgi:hypothetical protein
VKKTPAFFNRAKILFRIRPLYIKIFCLSTVLFLLLEIIMDPPKAKKKKLSVAPAVKKALNLTCVEALLQQSLGGIKVRKHSTVEFFKFLVWFWNFNLNHFRPFRRTSWEFHSTIRFSTWLFRKTPKMSWMFVSIPVIRSMSVRIAHFNCPMIVYAILSVYWSQILCVLFSMACKSRWWISFKKLCVIAQVNLIFKIDTLYRKFVLTNISFI